MADQDVRTDRRRGLGLAILAIAALAGASAPGSGELGPFVTHLFLCQNEGTTAAADPANDARLKAALAKAIAKDGALSYKGLTEFLSPEAFAKLAGADGKIDADEARSAIEAGVPASRRALMPDVTAHVDFLATGLDQMGASHREAARKLAAWIAANYEPGKPLEAITVCTGNSRRSILGATMGNIAAAYCGMPEIRFTSGGTAPSAFNARTITALKAIGVQITPTGEEAPKGEPQTANSISQIRWGEGDMTAREFSKKFTDPGQPKSNFAAIMVCSEADAACPFVAGASARISAPYLDPKIYDGSPYEAAKYAERRDDIGRMMLSAMLQARRIRETASKTR